MHDIGIDDVIWQGQCEQCSYRAWAAIDEDKAAAIWNRLAEVYKEMAKKQSYE
jgi:predicted ATP-dependent serine protease